MSDSELSSNSESENEEESGQELDLDASETESDEGSNADVEKQTKTNQERVREDVLHKYQERQGRQLYIRFPHRLPIDEAEFQEKIKALSPLIVEAHKPRQKHARFCLVDFNSNEDRDAALREIRAKENQDYKIVASLPHTENVEFIEELAERKLKSLENKKAKTRLRRASKQALRAKNFTSSIVILNLPKTASVAEVRKLFPNAVDIQIKAGKGKMNGSSIGAITLPSTMDARSAVRQKLSLGGTQLVIRFDSHQVKKQQHRRKPLKRKSSDSAGLEAKKTKVAAQSPTKKSKATKAKNTLKQTSK